MNNVVLPEQNAPTKANFSGDFDVLIAKPQLTLSSRSVEVAAFSAPAMVQADVTITRRVLAAWFLERL